MKNSSLSSYGIFDATTTISSFSLEDQINRAAKSHKLIVNYDMEMREFKAQHCALKLVEMVISEAFYRLSILTGVTRVKGEKSSMFELLPTADDKLALTLARVMNHELCKRFHHLSAFRP